ncbi:V(D)J recombination-activating protein 1-like [Branchiostoma floridae]|uniref:V(D)J recombination-activating protein 1-like n=1 Tax=Branchiostoma floridae TaxID=7739 RepID=A0A9J7LZS1_BRAFL|nr:V(D)J recombination-activating protein 1-like [Branchiostoma floridae]
MDHKQKLANVCRVCGLRFKFEKGRKPKPVSAFREAVVYLYNGYDVQQDIEDVHPPSVCEKCRRALARVQNLILTGNAPTPMLPTKLPDFGPHGDPCNICVYKQGGYGRPPKKYFFSKVRVPSSAETTATLEPVLSEPTMSDFSKTATPPAMSEPATPPTMSKPAMSEPAMSEPATPPAMSEPAMSEPATLLRPC